MFPARENNRIFMI